MTDNLESALQAADLLLVDGLHASEFAWDPEAQVWIVVALEGRTRREWRFTPAQLATAEPAGEAVWLLAEGHRLECLGGISVEAE